MVRSENKWTFLLYRAWVQLSTDVMLTMFYTNVEFFDAEKLFELFQGFRAD